MILQLIVLMCAVTIDKTMSMAVRSQNQQPTVWVIGVNTGDIGSDANVAIKLQGDMGSSDFMTLDDHRDNYTPNHWDYYTIETPAGTAVGNVESVQITVDAEQWSLRDVIISNLYTGEIVYCHPDLPFLAAGLNTPATVLCSPARKPAYLLAISTGTRGSDGLTSIKLVGSKASTAFIAVDNPGINDWESFSTDFIMIYPSDYSTKLGNITDIQMKTDSDGHWDLERVVLYELDAHSLKPVCKDKGLVCTYRDGLGARSQSSADSCMTMEKPWMTHIGDH